MKDFIKTGRIILNCEVGFASKGNKLKKLILYTGNEVSYVRINKKEKLFNDKN
jgi:hypothetical protein